MKKVLSNILMAIFIMNTLPWLSAETFCENSIYSLDNFYFYELSTVSGQACITLTPDNKATYSIQWQNVEDMISHYRIEFPVIGYEEFNFSVDFQPEGVAQMGLYGIARDQSSDSYIEYFIIESWNRWKPPGNTPLGTFTSDGGVYEIFRATQDPFPTRKGVEIREKYYSVRTSNRTRGIITVGNHFNAWKQKGMEMDSAYYAAFSIQAYHGSGYAELEYFSHGSCCIQPTDLPKLSGDVNGDAKIDILDALLVTQFYVGVNPEVFHKANADVNHDGEITIVDALLIAQCYVGQNFCDF